MEIIYYLTAVCLIAFMILATYDGAYLHLWKYELFKQSESKFEHATHTIRAILFPAIVWMIFLNHDPVSFWIGVVLILLDFVVLAVDAYSEKDSREFMGGLPRSEYIMHLMANGFHFAAIFLMLSTKLVITESSIELIGSANSSSAAEVLDFIAVNMLPGAILLGLLHLFLMTQSGQTVWGSLRKRVVCC
ncbi:MAG: hypothetical protein AB8B56_06980 [Crocinitomicaceae bacterium]